MNGITVLAEELKTALFNLYTCQEHTNLVICFSKNELLQILILLIPHLKFPAFKTEEQTFIYEPLT